VDENRAKPCENRKKVSENRVKPVKNRVVKNEKWLTFVAGVEK